MFRQTARLSGIWIQALRLPSTSVVVQAFWRQVRLQRKLGMLDAVGGRLTGSRHDLPVKASPTGTRIDGALGREVTCRSQKEGSKW